MSQLEPCPQCHRHVKITETACPFCAQALAEAFAQVVPRSTPGARLGRAAMFAFGVAAAVPGCGDDVSRPDAANTHVDAGPPDADPDAGAVPIYAAAPTPPPDDRG